MAVEEIVAGVHAIGMGYVNAFLIAGDDGLALVDSGLPKKKDPILRAVAAVGRRPADLKHILITHHHIDHIGSLGDLMEATGAKSYVHPLDSPIVRGDRPQPGPTPAHTPGHLAFLLARDGGVLFAGDAAANVIRLGMPIGMFTADREQAKESVRKLAALEFEVACFGHGRVLKGEANLRVRRLAGELAR